MKKIWFLLLLLLLLILYCLATKTDQFYTSAMKSRETPVQKIVPIPQKPSSIEFEITKSAQYYRLNGIFASKSDIQALTELLHSPHHTLVVTTTSKEENLTGKAFVTLTRTILPHFMEHYSEGNILYQDDKLVVNGDVKNYEVRHKMQRLLSTSTLKTENNTKVIYEKPISFMIQKTPTSLSLDGKFGNKKQIEYLIQTIQNHGISLNQNRAEQHKHHVDKQSALALTNTLLPIFMQAYTEGKLLYDGERVTLHGFVQSEATIQEMNRYLKATKIPFTNTSEIDPQIVAQKKEKEEREKEKTFQEQLQREINNELIKAERVEMQQHIVSFLQREIIEFKSGEASLTPKGVDAVRSLAMILNRYTHTHIELGGHTDSEGDDTFNQMLSQNRVDRVKEILIEEGVNANRVIAKGYGETQPLVPNTTEENKQTNRRVEITIIGE